MTTRAQLISRISRYLNDVAATRPFYGVGETGKALFSLRGKPVVPGSISISVNGDPVTDFTADYENGTIDFTTAPADSATIVGSYQYSRYSHQTKNDALNDVITGGFIQKEVYDPAAIVTVAGTYAYDLPAACFNLLEVWIHDSEGNRVKRLRQYTEESGSGTDGLDQIIFRVENTAARNIGLRYASTYTELDDDADDTDLPRAAFKCVCMMAAADVFPGEEAERLSSTKKLGYKGDTDGARELAHLTLGERLEQKAMRERSIAGLEPDFSATLPIINN